MGYTPWTTKLARVTTLIMEEGSNIFINLWSGTSLQIYVLYSSHISIFTRLNKTVFLFYQFNIFKHLLMLSSPWTFRLHMVRPKGWVLVCQSVGYVKLPSYTPSGPPFACQASWRSADHRRATTIPFRLSGLLRYELRLRNCLSSTSALRTRNPLMKN